MKNASSKEDFLYILSTGKCLSSRDDPLDGKHSFPCEMLYIETS